MSPSGIWQSLEMSKTGIHIALAFARPPNILLHFVGNNIVTLSVWLCMYSYTGLE